MGEFKVDPATIAFRLALAEASEQEQARADALLAFWQRPIFVATWPSPNEAPRTLTNSQGETALPLFTGLDTLELGADRFSWREPNGSIRFREMSAREAFRYALTRQVNFVVVDVGFEHNVEFAREEFEPLVLQKEAQHAAARSLPPSASATRTAAYSTQQPSAAAALRQQISTASSPLPAATSQPQASAPSVAQSGQYAHATSSQRPQHRSEPAQPSLSASTPSPRQPSEQAHDRSGPTQ
ncbi:MAG TPA: SseB family protein, partial [Polyangiales bacterium]|nr:SseB family protein [Polyangiales bacterium]